MAERARLEADRAEETPAGAVAAPTPEPALAQVLSLQQSAGNQAVARVLSRQKVADPPIPDDKPRSIAILPEDRKVIEAETNMEISTAFTAFTDACRSNIDSLKAAAKAQAEAVALVMDIATGFLAPAFAAWQAERYFGKLAAKASKSLEIVGQEKAIALIAQQDLLKASFTGVAKVGSDQVKRNAQALFGEADEDLLLENLKNEFQVGAVALAGKVPTMSDTELMSVWFAYDPGVANTTAYKARIKTLLDQYEKYVKAIMEMELDGDHAMQDYSKTVLGIRAYKIDAYGKYRVVLLNERDEYSMFSSSSKKFRAWVPKMWEPLAEARTKQVFGAFTEIKGDQIEGHLPAPPS